VGREGSLLWWFSLSLKKLHGHAAPVLVAAREGARLLLSALAESTAVVGSAALTAQEAAGDSPADEGDKIDYETDEAEEQGQHDGHGAGQDAGQPPENVKPRLKMTKTKE
jgi:hypothetical protein